jgi:hypothetical protein
MTLGDSLRRAIRPRERADNSQAARRLVWVTLASTYSNQGPMEGGQSAAGTNSGDKAGWPDGVTLTGIAYLTFTRPEVMKQ